MNEFKYEPERRAAAITSGPARRSIAPTTARIVASARREGEKPHASEVLTPAAVFLNGTRVEDLQEAVSLRAGANPILVRYDQAGRGYFVLKRDGSRFQAARSRTPLAMTWFDDPSVIRFDVHAGARPAEWFRFTAPPGLRAMTVTAKGAVEAWADGQPMRAAGQRPFRGRCAAARARPSSPCAWCPRPASAARPCFPIRSGWNAAPASPTAGRLVEDGRAGVLLRRRVVSQDRDADAGAGPRRCHARSRQGGRHGRSPRERPAGRHPRRAALARGHLETGASPARTGSRCWCSTRWPTTTSPSPPATGAN